MSTRRDRDKRALGYLRGAMAVIAVSLPLLSLSAFGIWWLWQNNLLIIWSVVATAVALLIYSLEAYLIWRSGRGIAPGERPQKSAGSDRADAAEMGSKSDMVLPLREQEAHEAVEAIAAGVEPDVLSSREAVVQIGLDTVEAVARHMHPSEKEPLWKFTVPEALAVVEQVSRQVNKFVVNNVPLGERVTVGQLLTVYRWRSLVSVAERAYDLWRILRFVNPASAVAGEIREKVSGQFIEGMRSELLRRVARAYVREVGQAAIDLYSGRLRPDLGVNKDAEATTAAFEQLAERPLSILVMGQEGAGRGEVIAALALEMDALIESEIGKDGVRTTIFKQKGGEFSAIISEPPPIGEDRDAHKLIVKKALDCDIVLAVVSSARPDRAVDSDALSAIRLAFAERTDRTAPPVGVVLTRVEKLRPFKEWNPPYDLTSEHSEKARSIREAVEAVGEDLAVETDDIIPVVASPELPPYNIDALVAEIVEITPEARRAQITRHLSSQSGSFNWGQVWTQTLNAGKVLARNVTRRG